MTKPETIIRISDVRKSPDGTKVAYYLEDKEFLCLWEGAAPGIGHVYAIDPEHPGRDARKISAPSSTESLANTDVLRWRKPVSPQSGISRMEILRRRALIRRALRSYLDSQGFIEIDVPHLVHGASPDVCVDSFKVDDRYLVSSTEYQLKRLVMGGFTRLYSLTNNYRKGDDTTSFRNPEFTMLEWGRVGETMRAMESDIEAFVAEALEALKLPSDIVYQNRIIDMKGPWERLPVLEAINRYTGAKIANFDAPSCRKAAETANLEIHPEWAENKNFLFSLLMDHIQPNLGTTRPVFLTEWPLFETTSASADPSDPTLANRTELYIGGIEIADGFAGLADAKMQEYLFKTANGLRVQEGKDAVELDERYLAAMHLGTPYGAGMALGFDRLVMLLTDQKEIRSVLAFAWDEV